MEGPLCLLPRGAAVLHSSRRHNSGNPAAQPLRSPATRINACRPRRHSPPIKPSCAEARGGARGPSSSYLWRCRGCRGRGRRGRGGACPTENANGSGEQAGRSGGNQGRVRRLAGASAWAAGSADAATATHLRWLAPPTPPPPLRTSGGSQLRFWAALVPCALQFWAAGGELAQDRGEPFLSLAIRTHD
jgi:hypothetical protein